MNRDILCHNKSLPCVENLNVLLILSENALYRKTCLNKTKSAGDTGTEGNEKAGNARHSVRICFSGFEEQVYNTGKENRPEGPALYRGRAPAAGLKDEAEADQKAEAEQKTEEDLNDENSEKE